MEETSLPSGHIRWLKDLDLLSIHSKIRKDESGQLWDPVRKAWLAPQPEEWVRLCLTHYLADKINFSLRRMSVERATSSSTSGRYDLTLYDQEGKPFLLCECKSPTTSYQLDHLLQLAQYNHHLHVRFIMWTNGPQAWLWDNEEGQFVERLDECIDQYL